MARDATRAGKGDSLTIRLDAKTRFILEYLSRLRGQTITTIVERSLVAAAEASKIEDPTEFGGELGWDDFWDVSEGVRALRLSRHRAFFPTYDEDRRLAFVKQHWPFFAFDRDLKTFNNEYVDLFWPDIDALVQLQEDQRSRNANAAAERMMKMLEQGNYQKPNWPPPPPPAPKDLGRRGARDLDDEIPF